MLGRQCVRASQSRRTRSDPAWRASRAAAAGRSGVRRQGIDVRSARRWPRAGAGATTPTVRSATVRHPGQGPVEVGLGTDRAVDISVGTHQACARLASTGAITCWGGNEKAALGISGGMQLAPIVLQGSAKTIGTLHHGGCFIDATDNVKCWGSNSGNALGVAGGDRESIGLVPGINKAVRAGKVGRNGCAVEQTGDVRCWGAQDSGTARHRAVRHDDIGESPARSPPARSTSRSREPGPGRCVRTGRSRAGASRRWMARRRRSPRRERLRCKVSRSSLRPIITHARSSAASSSAGVPMTTQSWDVERSVAPGRRYLSRSRTSLGSKSPSTTRALSPPGRFIAGAATTLTTLARRRPTVLRARSRSRPA